MKTLKRAMMLFCIALLVGCGSKLEVGIKENIETEYGEKLDHSLLFDKEKSEENLTVKEVKDYDNKKLGEQEITVVFAVEDKTQEEKVKVTVKDTKAPEIKLKKDKLEITEGDDFNSASNIESVKDPVDGDIKKSDDSKVTKNGYIITSDVDAKKVKDGYKVKITAYDVNGNKAEKEYTVNVKAKPEEPKQSTSQSTYTTPAQSGGGNSAFGSGGVSAGQSVPSQPQQTCQVGVIHPNAIGNTGMIFNSEQEAIDYGNKMSGENLNIASFGYSQVFDYCDNILDKWTVSFTYVGDYH